MFDARRLPGQLFGTSREGKPAAASVPAAPDGAVVLSVSPPHAAGVRTAPEDGNRCIASVLARLQSAVADRWDDKQIALRDVLLAMDRNSFPVLLLVFSLLLVSPLSAIPGATTVFGLTIASIMAQLMLGRQYAWLPGVLLDRPLPVQRTLKALHRLEKPAGWLGRFLRVRLAWVVDTQFNLGPKFLVLAAALCAPLMEVIPMSGSSVGAAIALFSAGLLARDGAVMLIGACLAAIMPFTLWLLLS